MDDLTITRLCAEAMELDYHIAHLAEGDEIWVRVPPMKPPALYSYRYCPLYSDAQAMALVKKLGLDIHCRADMNGWYVGRERLHEGLSTHADLNHAICNAVAAIQMELTNA